MTPTNSLFEEPWWLDAAAPGAWDAVEIGRGDAIVARLPYVRHSRLGRAVLTQPALSPTLGPWLAPSDGKPSRRLEVEKERLNELIEGLPPFGHFRQNFSPAIRNWLPFHWAGFSASVRYTYRLEALEDEAALWSGLSESTRRQVRKAEREVEIRPGELGELLELGERTFRRQGISPPYSRDQVERVDEAAATRGARTILVAADAQGRRHAAAYLVHDQRATYYLLGGRDEELAASGAPSGVLWEAIRTTPGRSALFDFEGSMIEPIERFFRGFGGRQTAYFRVEKSRGLLGVLGAGRDLVTAVRRR